MFKGEYIGITDNNGNEIHEGNTVKWKLKNDYSGSVRIKPDTDFVLVKIVYDPYTSSFRGDIVPGQETNIVSIGFGYADADADYVVVKNLPAKINTEERNIIDIEDLKNIRNNFVLPPVLSSSKIEDRIPCAIYAFTHKESTYQYKTYDDLGHKEAKALEEWWLNDSGIGPLIDSVQIWNQVACEEDITITFKN